MDYLFKLLLIKAATDIPDIKQLTVYHLPQYQAAVIESLLPIFPQPEIDFILLKIII